MRFNMFKYVDNYLTLLMEMLLLITTLKTPFPEVSKRSSSRSRSAAIVIRSILMFIYHKTYFELLLSSFFGLNSYGKQCKIINFSC